MNPFVFDAEMFDALASDAGASERRRANCNVHQSLEDPIQRLFITLEPSSYVKPHRHSEKGKFEFFLLVSGKVLFFLFDDK